MPTIMPEINLPPAHGQRHVAVYGTLRRGGSNDIHGFRPAPRFVGNTTLRGTLYHMGLYPGLVLASSGVEGDAVKAEIYAVCPALEAALDELEAAPPSSPDEYSKRELSLRVETEAGCVVLDCFLYEVNPSRVVGCPVIQSGDWLAGDRHSV